MKRSRGMGLYCAGLYAFLYLPLAVMTAFSFNDATRNVVWHGFTLKWYRILFADADLMNAMATSLELAAAAAAIAAVLGLLASYALTRHKPFSGRQAYGALLDAPLMMREVALGADEWTAFVKVTLPLAMPAVVSGCLLAFTVSFEDFVTSFFLAGIGIVTMPIKVYSMMKFGVTPEVNALSVILLSATAILLALNAIFASTTDEASHI